jgi:hypothetical protein
MNTRDVSDHDRAVTCVRCFLITSRLCGVLLTFVSGYFGGRQRRLLADFGYCHGHVLKAVRAVDLGQTLVECTEREMTGLAGYL